MAKVAQELAACKQQIDELQSKIEEIRGSEGLKLLTELGSKDTKDAECSMKTRNTCSGHFGKIYALHWGPDSRHIVTASQDGKLIIWNAFSGNKQLAITLNSAWVMTCCFSDSYDYVASGGLDNTVSVFRTTPRDAQQGEQKFKSKELYRELEKHDGYLSCARFIDDSEILSASGDGTCILWDVETRTAKSMYMDHTGDVMAIALNKNKKTLFASGSVDGTVKIWDMRQGERSIANFTGHEADVNTVQWFPDGECIVSGSDDGTVRLFDMRSYRQINQYEDNENRSLHSQDPSGVTSVDVSQSGYYLFSAYDNGEIFGWNALKGSADVNLPHESRVSALAISPNGYGLATGCWDFNLRIFA